MDLTVKVPPTKFSIDVALAKGARRIRHASEDHLIEFWIAAADAHVEKSTNRALMEQTLVLRLRKILPTVFLPRPPLSQIIHVKYTPENGDTVTVDEEGYRQSIDRMVTRLDIYEVPILGRRGTMEIEYVAGASDPCDVPPPLRQASLMLVGHWLMAREATYMDPRIMNISKKTELGFDELVREYRVPNGDTLNDDWS